MLQAVLTTLSVQEIVNRNVGAQLDEEDEFASLSLESDGGVVAVACRPREKRPRFEVTPAVLRKWACRTCK